jgi:hypothetical protein
MALDQFASPTGADGCNAPNTLGAFYLFDDPWLCQQTLTSLYNYKVSQDGKVITTYSPRDSLCNGTHVAEQTVTQGQCLKLALDNPVVRYKVDLLTASCEPGTCGGNQTCCWTPDLPGHHCGSADACCCPDFRTACPSGSSCGCEGLCPGPTCQCVGCFPNQNKTQFGLCNNKGIPETFALSKKNTGQKKVVVAKNFYLPQDLTATPEEGVACPDCAKFMADNLNNLVNIILQIGVEGNCEKLCGDLHTSPAATAVCELLCLAVGLDEFVKILQSEDLDPVWICKELHVCPVNDCVGDCVQISNVSVSPSIAKLRTEFVISFMLKGLKSTGTLTTNVQFPCLTSSCQNPVVGFDVVLGGLKVGETQTFELKIPTDEDSWMYKSDATYPVSLLTCQYDCGDIHSSIYSWAYTNFTVLKDSSSINSK